MRPLLSDEGLAAALGEARANPHPWYRCQCLTSVAVLIDDPDRAALVLEEALAAAKEQDQPNRVVSVAAWPVGVLVRRSLGDGAGVVADLLKILSREPNPIRRADALLFLLAAVIRDALLRHTVLTALPAACSASRGWKGRRILQSTALVLAPESGRLAQHVLSLIPESRESRRTKQMLERREWLDPDRLVPYFTK